MKDKLEFHCLGSCNSCGKECDYVVTDVLDGHTIMGADTKCKTCGFEDSCYAGWYGSKWSIESKCDKYSF